MAKRKLWALTAIVVLLASTAYAGGDARQISECLKGPTHERCLSDGEAKALGFAFWVINKAHLFCPGSRTPWSVDFEALVARVDADSYLAGADAAVDAYGSLGGRSTPPEPRTAARLCAEAVRDYGPNGHRWRDLYQPKK